MSGVGSGDQRDLCGLVTKHGVAIQMRPGTPPSPPMMIMPRKERPTPMGAHIKDRRMLACAATIWSRYKLTCFRFSDIDGQNLLSLLA
jgi:hypothetical protein